MIKVYAGNYLRNVKNVDVRINKAVAKEVASGMLDEFEVLVAETAQWSGRTAASWNIGWGMSADSRPPASGYPRGKKPVANAGHMAAVNDAVQRASEKLAAYADGEYQRGDLVVYNNEKVAEYVQEPGWLRAPNKVSVGSFERFKDRVETRSYIIAENIVL
jgi:hypothetical protein